MHKSNTEVAVIYSSIAQTYQDLENYTDALEYFELELKTHSINEESVINLDLRYNGGLITITI